MLVYFFLKSMSISFILCSLYATIDQCSNNNLDHIEEFETPRTPLYTTKSPEKAGSSSSPQPPILINSGLPPVPTKLVTKAQNGLFIEMADLLPEKLISAKYYTEGNTDSLKRTHHEIANIVEWMQCFGVYIAIIYQKEPKRTTDLLGYQQLIINASQTGREGVWLVYDRHFCLKASALGLKDWSSVEMNVWWMTDRQRSHHNVHCRTPTNPKQWTGKYVWIGMTVLILIAHIPTANLNTVAIDASSTQEW